MADAVASQADKTAFFAALRPLQPGNSVCIMPFRCKVLATDVVRNASIVLQMLQHGLLPLSVSTFVSIALHTTEIWEHTSPLCGQWDLTVCAHIADKGLDIVDRYAEWKLSEMRTMKVGGNDAATKWWQSHGGTALLRNKDPRTKYDSEVARKYKLHLKTQAAADARQ